MPDSRFLPAGDPEFVVLGDTHYMLEKADVEFESRRRQTERIEYAIDRINALEPDFVVHLGDLVQEYPGSDAYDEAVDAALAQLDRLEPPVHYVAGNHDVGDKPDPTMPTDWVSESSLERYHEAVGRSWTAWEAGGCHFVVLNSQVINASLDAADDQRAWFDALMARIEAGPVFVFLHLPPYLNEPDEPSLGHYDNLAEPARSWLLDHVRSAPVAGVFAGHCHFGFLDRIGDARVRVCQSVAFTRPGFAELFSSGPPPERGRDETAKLGCYLVRVIDDEPIVQPIRTRGRTDRGAEPGSVLTRQTADLPTSPVGVSLAYPLTNGTEIPQTFPSSIRYSVSNAYPTLGCLDMGVGVVRLPVAEVESGASRQYLDELNAQGATIVGTVLGEPGELDPHAEQLDELEVRLPPARDGMADGFGPLRAIDGTGVGRNLSRVVPTRDVPGKQHARLRNGFAIGDLSALDRELAECDLAVDRVTCRIPDGTDPWDVITTGPSGATFDRIGAVDWLLSSMNVPMSTAVDRIARTLAAVATRRDERVYLEPLRAMDRTMDPAAGLLDRRCSPTAAFHTVAWLNTVLFRPGGGWAVIETASRNGVDRIGLERDGTGVWLALPTPEDHPSTVDLPRNAGASVDTAVSLPDGRPTTVDTSQRSVIRVAADEPVLVTTTR